MAKTTPPDHRRNADVHTQIDIVLVALDDTRCPRQRAWLRWCKAMIERAIPGFWLEGAHS